MKKYIVHKKKMTFKRRVLECRWLITGLVRGLLRFPFQGKQYEIKRGYTSRDCYYHFDATQATDEAQKEVYLSAKWMMQEHGLTSVVDVGSGSGYKLTHILGYFETVGMDLAETYAHLVKTYPDRRWLNVDEGIDFEALEGDLVVCSDVIEHVVDPDALLNDIKKIRGLKYVVISTPERDLCRGRLHYGPPGNPSHQREWNCREFYAYISRHFDVVLHQVSNIQQDTQMIIGAVKTS